MLKIDSCDYPLWIKLCQALFDQEQNVLLGTVYTPPEGSKYVTNDTFYEIEQSIINLARSDHVALVGDFNARINNLCDH